GKVFISSYMDNGAKATALDAETGKVIWEKEIGDGSYFGPALGGDTLFVGSYDSQELYALSIQDGLEKWKVYIKGEGEGFASAPVYVDGVVYTATGNFDTAAGTLRAYDANNGNELWKANGIGNIEAGSPIVFDHLVIVGSK